jgi:hypothetical protein
MRRDFEDIGFTVVATQKDEAYVHFDVYEIVAHSRGATDGGGYDVLNWPLKGGSNAEDTDNLDEAQRYLHGEVKFDGCSNWYFDEQDEVMLHFCSLKDIQAISKVMEHCWLWASELIPNWMGSND